MEQLVKFVTSPWFMWWQVGSCLLGCVGFLIQRHYAMAWVWLCYASANLGFVAMAGGFK